MRIQCRCACQIALLSSVLVLVTSCSPFLVSDDSYRVVVYSESGARAVMVVPRLAPPPGAPRCEDGTNLPAAGGPVGPETETIRIGPPRTRRSAALTVLPGEPGAFNLAELPDEYPSVLAAGRPRPVRITLSGLGCTWSADLVLALFEWDAPERRWVERERAEYPEQWTVTAEIPELNSRFALGTARASQ